MVKHEWKRRCWQGGLTAMTAIAAGGLLAAPAAQAEMTDFAAFDNARQLNDDELDQLRGRFVDKGKILYFGVQMSSEWRTSAGEHLLAGGTLHGDLSGQQPVVSFEPYLNVKASGEATAVARAGNGASVSDAGTGNARGVVQTIQAGGDFNTAANDLQIDMMDASHPRGPLGQPGASSLNRHLPSGTRVAIQHGAQGVGVDLEVPDLGRVQQGIVAGHGLRQSIQLTSDFQQVQNVTRLQLYMDQQSTNRGSLGLRGAMDSARQLNR